MALSSPSLAQCCHDDSFCARSLHREAAHLKGNVLSFPVAIQPKDELLTPPSLLLQVPLHVLLVLHRQDQTFQALLEQMNFYES